MYTLNYKKKLLIEVIFLNNLRGLSFKLIKAPKFLNKPMRNDIYKYFVTKIVFSQMTPPSPLPGQNKVIKFKGVMNSTT